MAGTLHLAVSRIPTLRLKERILLLESCGTAECLFKLARVDLEALIGRNLPATFSLEKLAGETERCIKMVEASGASIIAFTETGYPPQLREIYDPPFLLFIRGSFPDFEKPMAGIVGTRNPSREAEEAAFLLGGECAFSQVPVVSGLARGIDSAAHWGAVSGDGITIAVFGCGIDTIYPGSNRKLAAKILERGGALVSEYPPGIPPLRYHFPERNRIISGLCRSVVVVQAPLKSGALITVDFALDQGRDLLVHSRGLDGPQGAGSRKLADEGASEILSAEGLFSSWGEQPSVPFKFSRIDPDGEKSARLLEEELSGTIVRYKGRVYRKNPVPGEAS